MEWVKFYWLHELADKDRRATQTIYTKADEYIPILVEDAGTRTRFRNWKQDKPYRKQFLRLKDIQKYIKEKTGKDLIFKWEEQKSEWQQRNTFRKRNRRNHESPRNDCGYYGKMIHVITTCCIRWSWY